MTLQGSESTTAISSAVDDVLTKEFVSDQQRTACAQLTGGDLKRQEEIGRSVRAAAPLPYDPVIVRFYEEIIQNLQRELARYKQLVEQLTSARVTEAETGYAPTSPVTLPDRLKQKLLRTVTTDLSRVDAH